ncbi:hypothetical protein GZH53_08260 [Flavihumibacter sp. R14]|nr:hypothetical protein [Flavihumibacter soli]
MARWSALQDDERFADRTELKALLGEFTGIIILAEEGVLVEHYHKALQIMGIY